MKRACVFIRLLLIFAALTVTVASLPVAAASGDVIIPDVVITEYTCGTFD